MRNTQFKCIMAFLLLFFSEGLLMAANPYYKNVLIQGGYDDVAAINITAIPAQSEQYKIGMPFSLSDPSVHFGNSEKGRLIANWNLLSNGQFKIDVDAEIMHNYKEDGVQGGYRDGLGYVLLFVYNLSYYAGGKVYYIQDGSFRIDVPDSSTSSTVKISDIDILRGIQLDSRSLVGSADGDIYFMFDESSTGILTTSSYNSLPDGNYSAKVTLTLKVL